jgi:hypothetical protein
LSPSLSSVEAEGAIAVPQIIIHKADQPDVVVNFFDGPTAWPAKTVLTVLCQHFDEFLAQFFADKG